MLRKRIAPVVIVALLLTIATEVGCLHTPPNLSPAGATAFNKTRVIKALDLIRDTAISANAQTPSVLSTDDTRLVVQFHEATLRTIQASDVNWQTAVSTAIDGFSKTLTAAQRSVIGPYITLVNTLLQGLS